MIGIPDDFTGQAIIAFAIPNDEAPPGSGFTDELREHVADRIGKLARAKAIYFADDLPKTRSGKIMRRLLRDIADGKELGDVSTLRDPSVVEELQAQVAGSG